MVRELENRDDARSRLIVTLAAQNLEEVSMELEQVNEEYRKRRARLIDERDEMLRDAMANGVALRRLIPLSGLSKSRLQQIRTYGTSEQLDARARRELLDEAN